MFYETLHKFIANDIAIKAISIYFRESKLFSLLMKASCFFLKPNVWFDTLQFAANAISVLFYKICILCLYNILFKFREVSAMYSL